MQHPVRRFGCKPLPNGTSTLGPRDRQRDRCNPPLEHVLNSANDPVSIQEDTVLGSVTLQHNVLQGKRNSNLANYVLQG